MFYSELQTEFGPIGLCWEADRLMRVLLAPDHNGASSRAEASSDQTRKAPLPAWIREPITAYLTDPGYRLDCPVTDAGTVFERRVWATIAAIPSGWTRTYGAIAAELGSSARAVGGACRRNPVPLRIPCHRVVAAQGLGGFAGDRNGRLLEIKRWLLAHEARRADEATA
jgi:methylated-DNA-[protein]-cysteine S-methyltransferase